MPQLDGLRAIAVGSVVYSHWLPLKYHCGLPWGDAGVQLFFIISGFLITGILLRCRNYTDRALSVRAFYARRFLRICPLFYATLAFAFLANIPPVRETILWHLAYCSNIYFVWNQSFGGRVTHFWSLAVEEQFYLFWPAVVVFIPSRWVNTSVISLITIGVLSRIFLPVLFPGMLLLSLLPSSNFDALGLGALIALVNVGNIKQSLIACFIAGLPLYLVLFTLRRFGIILNCHFVLEHISILLFLTWLVGFAARGFRGFAGALLEISLLQYLGRISYGVYVIHNFAGIPVGLFTEFIGLPQLQYRLPGIILMAVFTIVASSFSWFFFESRINALKIAFPYKRPSSP